VTCTATLRTDRLLMRAWQPADRAPFAAMNADPQVMEHFTGLQTRETSDALVDRIEQGWADLGYGLWAVDRLDTGAFIGFIGLARATFEAPFTPVVEVGWRLAAAHWGNGFATEGGSAALRYGFGTLGLSEIVSFTARGNRPSWRVMERLGMVHEAAMDFDHPSVPEGHPVRPHVFYRITRDRWGSSASPRACQ